MKIKLINPRFDQPQNFELNPSPRVRTLGPFILLGEGHYLQFLFHIILGIVSLGVWFIFFPTSYMKSKIYDALWRGFRPASVNDVEILRQHNIKTSDIGESSDQVGISRLGSADHAFGRKNYDK